MYTLKWNRTIASGSIVVGPSMFVSGEWRLYDTRNTSDLTQRAFLIITVLGNPSRVLTATSVDAWLDYMTDKGRLSISWDAEPTIIRRKTL